MHLHLPGTGDELARVLRVHVETGAPGVLVDEEDLLPVLAAVHRAIDTAFLLRSGQSARSTDISDVGIRGVGHDLADAAGFVETHVSPGAAGIGRLVDAVAHHIAVADGPGLSGARPHDGGIRERNRERTDGGYGLAFEDRDPTIAPVRGLPDPA